MLGDVGLPRRLCGGQRHGTPPDDVVDLQLGRRSLVGRGLALGQGRRGISTYALDLFAHVVEPILRVEQIGALRLDGGHGLLLSAYDSVDADHRVGELSR